MEEPMTLSQTIEAPVTLRTVNGVCRITLNRPDRLNAVTPDLYETLGPIVERASDDKEVRCVVLTGAGKAFCAGRDLKAGSSDPAAASAGAWIERRIDYLRRHARIAHRLHTMGKPVIAMINGACAGAGLSLAGACDIRIAARSAVLTSAFVKVGLPGDMGGIWFWSRILGAGKARRLYLMSERFDADAAAEFGIVDQVVDDGALAETVETLARSFADGSARAYRYAKEALNAAESANLDAILDLEASHMAMAGIDAAFIAGEYETHHS
jgi:2-(1,2-epoxy-1,2-dihydrophenyl)acetyl-CoA isomerase